MITMMPTRSAHTLRRYFIVIGIAISASLMATSCTKPVANAIGPPDRRHPTITAAATSTTVAGTYAQEAEATRRYYGDTQGIRQCLFSQFHDEAKTRLSRQGCYVDGKQVGVWTDYGDTGIIEYEGPYVDGFRHGNRRRDDAKGCKEEGECVAERRQRTWIARYPAGWVT